MNRWVVLGDDDNGDFNSIHYEVYPTKEKALKVYEEWKSNIKEYVDDTGFTGDECIYIAKVEKVTLPITITDEKEVSFHFEWEEFEPKGYWIKEPPHIWRKCSVCGESGFAHYDYCPWCGSKNRGSE